MNANPEVMQALAPSSTRANQVGNARDPRPSDGRYSDGGRGMMTANASPIRISEDPMRRTDRYRLVMPWSSRV
jgi:hypothetical protein